MTEQIARNVLRNNLPKITDSALKTAMTIAIEIIDESLIEDWHLYRGNAKNYGLELHEFLGYSMEEYDKYVVGGIIMKPVYKCDYCNEMGTEEKIREHEQRCRCNYDRRSCYTCSNRKIKFIDGENIYICKADKYIPKGKIYEFCKSYKRKESDGSYDELINGLFSL